MRAKKRYGQHFLEAAWADRLVTLIAPDPADRFLEIGPGPGALTSRLAPRVSHVTAIELDIEMIERLTPQLPANVTLIHADFLDFDLSSLPPDQPVRVAGNLPYNVSAPILFRLIDAHRRAGGLTDATLMLQREVAERLVAVPGTKAYGILSVQLQLFARPSLLFRVSRHVFRPKPDVESAVVALDFGRAFGAEEPAGVDSDVLRRLIRTAFGQRRKMLRNSLAALGAPHPLPEAFATRRPESLAPAEFVALARALYGDAEAS